MVIKQKDDIQPALDTLQALLASRSLSKAQRELIEDELDRTRAGARGEKEAAYYIDFHLKDAKNYAIIHDLRLEHDGRVAQIDHLIIGRALDVFVIESKNFTTAIRMTPSGEFEVKTRYGWKGMASPVEQNKRHIRVLDDVITAHKLSPVRLGLQTPREYHNWVLVPPECTVARSVERSNILKMDMFDKRLNEWIEKGSEFSLKGVIHLSKIVSRENLVDFAQRLVSHHTPIAFDYAAKFGVAPQEPSIAGIGGPQTVAAAGVCANCGTPLDQRTVSFCQSNHARFAGRLLCRSCQQTTSTAQCQGCGTPVDAKVVAFCRFNSRKFGKRTLCRSCQTSAQKTLLPPPLPVAVESRRPEVEPSPLPIQETVTVAGTPQRVFLYIGEDVTGPFDVSQLLEMISSGTIGTDTPCCSADTQEWKTAGEFV